MTERIAIAGVAAAYGRDHPAPKADEVVFQVCSAALRQAGLRGQDVDQAMLSSLDLYDGRAISNGLLVPAAGGYLKDESRIEGDSSLAVVAAAANIRARQAEVAMVVAVSLPEIDHEQAADAAELRRFTETISNYTFDAHHARPLGMSAGVALALHSAHTIDRGEMTREEMARRAAADISRGAKTAWSDRRTEVTPEEVLAAPGLAWPVTELMLPGECPGVVAIVLASEARVRRAKGTRAWIRGWGTATGRHLAAPGWLADPADATRAAATKAYARSGIADPAELEVIETTALTPALQPPVERALGLDGDGDPRVNRTGGATSSYPGLANGALRVLKAVDALENLGSGGPALAAVHATDNLMGPISATSAVLVLERA
ncbi:hypothetical protein [Acrocarpospora catenulata]|uniref:hypothetical protein n=1 Tax=Acrocarpospora catenulata TaxID=2836182 RepID=UPI001BD91F0A|nr:hypothetical protein [Acrocarpospora catenulata]